MCGISRITNLACSALTAIVVLATLAPAQEPSARTAEMRNKADELLWIGDSVVIAVDFGGFVNKTAKLQAFRTADMSELWYTEVPVGKRQRFKGALWVDTTAGVMFLGHGPFSALNLRDGSVLWSVPYDTIGYVHDVMFGSERLLVLGSERKASFRVMWSLSPSKAEEKSQLAGSGYEHLEKPILFSLNRRTGEIAWEYAFEPGKEHKKKKSSWGSKTVYVEREPTRLHAMGERDDSGEYTLLQGRVIVQAKHLGCVDLAGGQEIWRIKEDFVGEPQVIDDRILAIKEDRLVALNGADGSEVWRSKDKVKSFWAAPNPFLVQADRILVNCGGKMRVLDRATGAEVLKSQKEVGDFTIFALTLDGGTPICVFPGKYDQSKDGYSEDYRVCCVSPTDGSLAWQFTKSKDYIDCELGPAGCIQLIDKERMWRLDPSTGKVLCECKIGDGVVLSDAEAPIVLSNDGLRCFTPDGKKEAWRYKAKLSDEGVENSFYRGSTLLMATKKEGLQAIDLKTGTLQWSLPLNKAGMVETSESLSSVAIATDKKLRVLDLNM